MSDDDRDPLHEQARQLSEQVQDAVKRGDTDVAVEVFRDSWRDAVPGLPTRFSVILQQPDADMAAVLLRRAGRPSRLRLKRADDRTAVEVTGRRRGRLGLLPAADARLAAQGDYVPHLLEIRFADTGRLDYVAIELVRHEDDDQHAPVPISFHEAVEAIAGDETPE